MSLQGTGCPRCCDRPGTSSGDSWICLNQAVTDSLSSGTKTAAFGGAIGVAALFFTSGIPRIKSDILQVCFLAQRLNDT